MYRSYFTPDKTREKSIPLQTWGFKTLVSARGPSSFDDVASLHSSDTFHCYGKAGQSLRVETEGKQGSPSAIATIRHFEVVLRHVMESPFRILEV